MDHTPTGPFNKGREVALASFSTRFNDIYKTDPRIFIKKYPRIYTNSRFRQNLNCAKSFVAFFMNLPFFLLGPP
jgi:hypothetical protein